MQMWTPFIFYYFYKMTLNTPFWVYQHFILSALSKLSLNLEWKKNKKYKVNYLGVNKGNTITSVINSDLFIWSTLTSASNFSLNQIILVLCKQSESWEME